ncbi:MAG: exonuclease domain-containing protein [Alphaproteobacteria bacterium]|nr:exonuclease domain-containing protein [Alphaproteobacteria bacterium]
MSFVIFDTEYTSWKGCQEHGWFPPQKKEIVQIAAIKVSENFEVLETFKQLCRPSFNPVLSDYFTELTGITNEQVAQYGILFENAYQKFANFINKDICFSHSWNADYYHKSDGAIIEENLNYYKLNTCSNIIFRNIAAVFKALYEKNNISIPTQSSGEIALLLNLGHNLKSLNMQPHNALYDAFSILEGLKHFRNNIASLSTDGFVLK